VGKVGVRLGGSNGNPGNDDCPRVPDENTAEKIDRQEKNARTPEPNERRPEKI
jgi:hypothetical protein